MESRNYYNIVYTRSGVLLHPSFLRDEISVIVLNAMLSPLDDLHTQFTALRNGLGFRTYSQVCYMQGLLNDSFDPLERRIRIRNAHLNIDSYRYWKERTNNPVQLCKEGTENFVPRIENRDFQIGSTNLDFEVVLPIGFSLSEEEENRLQNIVNQNKLASKRYKIVNL